MEHLPKKITNKLAGRLNNNALRRLVDYKFTYDFATNDYLGINRLEILNAINNKANSNPQLGATGSRLLTGNHSAYVKLEQQLDLLHKVDGALVFNSGYAANLGLIGAVPQKGDLILYDQLVHASIREAIQLSQAKAYKFKHNDLDNLAQLLARHTSNFDHVYVVTESVFSMDGDSPELEQLCELCANTNSYLIVDEAHAVGVFGEYGTGLVQAMGLEQQVFARVITFGKAVGCHGAAVLGSAGLKQFLINFARSLIYTTALPEHAVNQVAAVYTWMQTKAEFVQRNKTLHSNIAILQSYIKKEELTAYFVPSCSPIHCCILPGNTRVKNSCHELQKLGFGVLPILAPTVPTGQERIRICLHAHNSEAEIRELVKTLAQLILEHS